METLYCGASFPSLSAESSKLIAQNSSRIVT
jgi:hypothetical protein